MSPNENLRFRHVPELREPVLIAAFAGWNDASQAATFALASLLNLWSAREFADIDPETFFVFTETRPTVTITPAGQRALRWPGNHFFAYGMEGSDRDIVLLVGTEPQLRWRAFCESILQVADRVNASCLITLGGLLAEVPHTAPPGVSGFASSEHILPQLRALGIELSSYEGPTGIIGALHEAWDKTGRPAMSLWGSVPHYISASPNPNVSLALLQRLGSLLGISLPLTALAREAAAFQGRIDEALEDNPEARQYVRDLEEQLEGESVPSPGPELMEQLEEFLRRRRPDDGHAPE
jgi:proteasome assembly chaperone (PAC2) family protein